MPAYSYVEENGSAAMLASKRLAGVTSQVNLKERETHTSLPIVNKATYSAFKTKRRHHQKSKTVVSVAPQEGLMSSNFFKKRSNGNVFKIIMVTYLQF